MPGSSCNSRTGLKATGELLTLWYGIKSDAVTSSALAQFDVRERPALCMCTWMEASARPIAPRCSSGVSEWFAEKGACLRQITSMRVRPIQNASAWLSGRPVREPAHMRIRHADAFGDQQRRRPWHGGGDGAAGVLRAGDGESAAPAEGPGNPMWVIASICQDHGVEVE